MCATLRAARSGPGGARELERGGELCRKLKRCVAAAGEGGNVIGLAAATGLPVATMRGHQGSVIGIDVSRDAAIIVSGGTDGTVRRGTAAAAARWRPPA